MYGIEPAFESLRCSVEGKTIKAVLAELERSVVWTSGHSASGWSCSSMFGFGGWSGSCLGSRFILGFRI